MLKKLFFSYKPDQGMAVRGTGLALLAALFLFGCYGFYFTALDWGEFKFLNSPTLFSSAIGGIDVPLVEQRVNLSFLVAAGVFLTMLFVSARIMNTPKNADLFIATEGELQKVTWPSWAETVNASMVVIFTTMFMALLLFVFDLVLSRVISMVL